MLIVLWLAQEAGGWGLPPPDCSPSKGASFSDRAYDNPTFSIFDSNTYEQSPDLALTILLAAWPLSSFPFVFQLPVGSVLVIAGTLAQACKVNRILHNLAITFTQLSEHNLSDC